MADNKMEQEVTEEVKDETTTTPDDGEETQTNQEVEDSQEAELTAEEKEADATQGEKESFFKKKKKVDPMKEKMDELEDKVKRQMAEFENFRKRSEKEKAQMFEVGAKSVIEKVLPVIDNFERGLSTVSEEEAGLPFVDGMQMIYKQMMTELENIGVKPIEALGKEFNPDLHNAVMQVESDEFEEGMVAQELMKGYLYRDTVVRHSMVGVVQ